MAANARRPGLYLEHKIKRAINRKDVRFLRLLAERRSEPLFHAIHASVLLQCGEGAAARTIFPRLLTVFRGGTSKEAKALYYYCDYHIGIMIGNFLHIEHAKIQYDRIPTARWLRKLLLFPASIHGPMPIAVPTAATSALPQVNPEVSMKSWREH